MSERLLRAAMVLQAYPPAIGGAQRQVQRLGPPLARRGIESTVLTRRPPGTPARAREPGLDVRRVSRDGRGPRASLAFVARSAACMARLRPDVVHVHDLLSPAVVALLGAVPRGVPVVAKVASTGPGGDVDRLLAKPLGRARLAAMARRFAAFACLTRRIEEELAVHGVPERKLWRLPNGVDAECFRPPSPAERVAARAALGLPEDGLVTLYCGRFAPVKRLDVAIEAFARMGEEAGVLVLAGGGEEEGRLRALVASLDGAAAPVRFVGAVDDVAPLHRAADLYLSASSTEGMSGAVLEAMASGVPVVAAPASGMQELLSGGCGVVTPDAGAEALAAGLRALAADPARRAALGERARHAAVERYSLEALADRLAAGYRRLVAGLPPA